MVAKLGNIGHNTLTGQIGQAMQKKLTITIDAQVYDGLQTRIGRRDISRFIESVVRPHVMENDLLVGYQQMAADEQHEAEALEWTDGLIGEVWRVDFASARLGLK